MVRVTNFFLVYASAAIAMLGLRAMFFVGVLGKLFSLMDQLLSSLMDQTRATMLSVFHLQVYTSAAVAMLGFRATLFISDVLGKLFSSLMDQTRATMLFAVYSTRATVARLTERGPPLVTPI